MPIKHAFTSEKEDGADGTLVRPSDWNADHVGESDDITKALLTEKGDIIYASDVATPAALAHGLSTQYLKSGGHGANPSWAAINGLSTIVHKTADETVNNSDTLQNDDELFFPVGANEVWEFQMLIRCTFGSAPDFDFLFVVPNGALIKRHTNFGTIAAEIDGTVERTETSYGTKSIYSLYLYIGGASAGNVQFQWAQNIATAEDTIVHANSFIIAHKLG